MLRTILSQEYAMLKIYYFHSFNYNFIICNENYKQYYYLLPFDTVIVFLVIVFYLRLILQNVCYASLYKPQLLIHYGTCVFLKYFIMCVCVYVFGVGVRNRIMKAASAFYYAGILWFWIPQISLISLFIIERV